MSNLVIWQMKTCGMYANRRSTTLLNYQITNLPNYQIRA
jgi:hypothetical protein